MNIALIGYRGSGKSTVGRIVADRLNREFVDSDTMIEKYVGGSIEEIVCSLGWPAFRALERELIRKLTRRKNIVLATGGGVVEDEDNRAYLNKTCWIVWLNCRERILEQRIRKDESMGSIRPSLMGHDLAVEIAVVMEKRMPIYQAMSHLVIDTSFRNAKEVAHEIINAMPDLLKESANAG